MIRPTPIRKASQPVNAAPWWRAAGIAVLLLAALAGCTGTQPPISPSPTTSAPSPTTPPSRSPTTPPTDSIIASATFVSVVDGDTITTSAGTIRLIGIDTPEHGECGHAEASAAIGRLLASGDPITLELPAGQNNHDRHGRLIRYVTTPDGVDLGLMQLEAGNAIARYDSTDGYPAHPREAAYHAAQLATPGPDRTVITTACQNPARSASPATKRWWERYASCGQLKRNTAGDPIGPFRRDGLACE